VGAALRFAARHARPLLVAALALGLAAPGLAAAVRPWLAAFVAATLCAVALRIGLRAALGALSDLRRVAAQVAVFQVALPLVAVAGLALAGVAETTFALALVITLAASPISGAPSLTLLVGRDPAPALRLVVAGTALLPLTVLPVLWASPLLGSAGAVLAASARLVALIGGAVALGFALRRVALPRPDPARIEAVDGLTALLVAGLILGLMAEAGAALRHAPAEFAGWFALAVALNFGVQTAAYRLLDPERRRVDGAGAAIVAGNRNLAVFLVALPEEVLAPALVYIGAYQIPMFLTPWVLGAFYRPSGPAPAPERGE